MRQFLTSFLAIARGCKRFVRRIAKILLLKLQAMTAKSARVVLGSGGISIPGWLSTDIDQLNALSEQDWNRFFARNSIDAILAEHVWEHLSEREALQAARNCFHFLRPGGKLRVAVPDGLHPDPAYVDSVRPGGTGPGAADHKVLYTFATLQDLFREAGFETLLLEHFDESGQFHAIAWDPSEGMIQRSARYDERNSGGMLRYTSIVIDVIKPRA